jgi:hypothetical protein
MKLQISKTTLQNLLLQAFLEKADPIVIAWLKVKVGIDEPKAPELAINIIPKYVVPQKPHVDLYAHGEIFEKVRRMKLYEQLEIRRPTNTNQIKFAKQLSSILQRVMKRKREFDKMNSDYTCRYQVANDSFMIKFNWQCTRT